MHWIAPTEKDTAAEQVAPVPHFTKAEYNGARLEGLVPGLSFLKYISGTFEEHRVKDIPGRASSPNGTPSSPSPRNWKPLSVPT